MTEIILMVGIVVLALTVAIVKILVVITVVVTAVMVSIIVMLVVISAMYIIFIRVFSYGVIMIIIAVIVNCENECNDSDVIDSPQPQSLVTRLQDNRCSCVIVKGQRTDRQIDSSGELWYDGGALMLCY